MKISNPPTPRSTELLGELIYVKNQLAYLREKRKDAPACLWEHLNNSISHWLCKLSELEGELRDIDNYCTCTPINPIACPACLEHAQKRYGDSIPIAGEL